MRALSRLDRRVGDLVRRRAARAGVVSPARGLAALMSPAFRVAVALLIAVRPTRRAGLEALAASGAAAMAARGLRDRLRRRRPGPRREGGFPSRHAAAATAIALTVGPRHAGLGAALGAGAAAGSLARVASAEHEPGDVLAGAALGAAVATAVRAVSRGVAPRQG